jgi:hypothetical protein
MPASDGSAGKPLPAHSGWSAAVTARPTPPAVGASVAPTPPPALAGTHPAPATPPPSEGRMGLAGPIDGHAATDPRLAAKPARSGNSSRTRSPQHGPHFVSAPGPRTFVRTVVRRIEWRF